MEFRVPSHRLFLPGRLISAELLYGTSEQMDEGAERSLFGSSYLAAGGQNGEEASTSPRQCS